MQLVPEILQKPGICQTKSYFHVICNSSERTKTIVFEEYYSILSYKQIVRQFLFTIAKYILWVNTGDILIFLS